VETRPRPNLAQSLVDSSSGSVPRTLTEPLSAPPDLSVHAVTPLAMTAPAFSVLGWAELLAEDASKRLQHTDPEVWGALTREFEKAVLQAALQVCRGRRVEAAARLGMGRNTITRKLRELGMDGG